MFFCMFDANWAGEVGTPTPPMNFGNPMMPNKHRRMVTAITPAFNFKFRCMEIYALCDVYVHFFVEPSGFDPAGGTSVLTEDRANCSFRLSGLTRNTIVSPSTAVMVPMMPLEVTTLSPLFNSLNICAWRFFCRCIGMNRRK